MIGLKTTVYRTSDESPLVPALIEASEEGKQSVCLVELKARFDERRNIEWSRTLERAGVHVVYGFPSLKIHSRPRWSCGGKATGSAATSTSERATTTRCTAQIYEDFGLFTADPDIAADVADLFNHLTGFGKPLTFRKILVAPFDLRERPVDEIRRSRRPRPREAGADPDQGQRSTDPAIIDELYEASRPARASTDRARDLLASARRAGMCENIHVRSVLGRFLEHSRVYHFDRGDARIWLMGSADLMPRNLDNRLELVVPVEEPACASGWSGSFAVLLDDNTSWVLQPEGTLVPKLRRRTAMPARAGRSHAVRAAAPPTPRGRVIPALR